MKAPPQIIKTSVAVVAARGSIVFGSYQTRDVAPAINAPRQINRNRMPLEYRRANP